MEDFKKLANRKWYNQRFDGSPMFMSMIAYAETKIEARKPKGTEATWRITSRKRMSIHSSGKATG